jgi:hypothetical protein
MAPIGVNPEAERQAYQELALRSALSVQQSGLQLFRTPASLP